MLKATKQQLMDYFSTPQEAQEFAKELEFCMRQLAVTTNTIGAKFPMMLEAVFQSYPWLYQAKPIKELPKATTSKALILGAGPSAQALTEKPADTTVFACWRMFEDYMRQSWQPDYVCNLDTYAPYESAYSHSIPVIGTCTTAPMFWELAQGDRYAYFDCENIIDSILAQVWDKALDPACIISVPSLMIHSAASMGFKTIEVAGVDLPGDRDDKDDQILMMQHLALTYPDIKFVNLSPHIQFEGWENLSTQRSTSVTI